MLLIRLGPATHVNSESLQLFSPISHAMTGARAIVEAAGAAVLIGVEATVELIEEQVSLPAARADGR